MYSAELKAALQELPHVKKVWLTEDGVWYLVKQSFETIEVSREEILPGEKPSEEVEEIEIKPKKKK